MNNALLIEFGQRVCAVREHLALEKSVFAAKLHISTHMLTSIESGTTTPGIPFLYHITQVYGVNPLYLLFGDKPFLLRKIPLDNSGVARASDKENAVEQLFWYMQRSSVVKFHMLEHFLRFKQENKHVILDDMETGNGENFGYIPVFRPSSEPCYLDLPFGLLPNGEPPDQEDREPEEAELPVKRTRRKPKKVAKILFHETEGN